jgi:hypothetical protein
LDELEKEGEKDIHTVMEILEEFFRPISEQLQVAINPEQVLDEEAVADPKDPKAGGAKGGAKKDDKKAPAKAAPKGKAGGELAAYESPLPTTTAGVETLILMLDSRLESLPIEGLEVFSKIPVVARDFSLHMHMNRLKTVGHQAQLHNNTGIQKDNLKYIIDAPDSIAEETKAFMEQEVPKLMPGSKWEGVLTKSQHYPSSGEWQRMISNSSLFAYFSMTALLHKFTPSDVTDMSIFSKCRAIAIFDKMNSFKAYVDRTVLTSNHFSPIDQPRQTAALFSLCGLSSITVNHWSVKPEENFEIYKTMVKTAMTEGTYLGASLRKYKAKTERPELEEGQEEPTDLPPEKLKLYRLNTINYGVPLLRVV